MTFDAFAKWFVRPITAMKFGKLVNRFIGRRAGRSMGMGASISAGDTDTGRPWRTLMRLPERLERSTHDTCDIGIGPVEVSLPFQGICGPPKAISYFHNLWGHVAF